ncbi:MAG: Rne/Rng family ribonuclease [bacterium]
MAKEIIINTNPDEIRVALLEDNLLAELYIERHANERIIGNIYKGRVTKVLPGMQAAFVDIGLKKDAFLYVLDVFYDLETYEQTFFSEVKEEEAKEQSSEAIENITEETSIEDYFAAPIEELLQEGQEILVQVSKEPIGTKGARVTSHVTLPGRYLVYMPTVEHIGISRRIEDKNERNRLKDLILHLKPSTGGYIVRTVGEGRSEKHFRSDIEFLAKLWHNIYKKSESVAAPGLIHKDLDIIFRTIRDIFTDEIQYLVIDSEVEYQRCLEFVSDLLPQLTNRVKLFIKNKPIFDEYNIEEQIEKALRNKVWLKSGGYVVIEETEALVAIDVNTGKYVGKKNLEETILKTNLEAAKEIARQIRLRDLGGIIIIDFIDMEEEVNKENLLRTLETALKADRSRSKILQLSNLGLVEMTRKRVKQSLSKTLCKPCPYSKGKGRIKSDYTIY